MTCHPLSKLNLITSTLYSDSGNLSGRFLENFTSSDVYAMGEVIDGAVSDIKAIVAAAEEQYLDLSNENDDLKKTLKLSRLRMLSSKKNLNDIGCRNMSGLTSFGLMIGGVWIMDKSKITPK